MSNPAGYTTSDLLAAHPTEPNLWRIVGRLNNVIVLANSYKLSPGPMEDIITAHALVQGALIFGMNRHASGVLIELASNAFPDGLSEEAIVEFKGKIWPAIVEADEQVETSLRVG
ncbi:hypothetical protein BDV98DRAFT_593201 [Pterulicium gracile]|uniref:Uncharacterized protein n=1 Tax=Pterulicium gracile TaxID=1884261 RepID=A0A5C3QHV6_9AGAR|nr:hypothetical protein BDV98DRAFT_593201 [Pterula gracilis]